MARFARDADALCDEMDTKYALAERVLAPLTAMGAADSFQPTDREEIPMGNWIELSLTKLAGRAPAGPAQRIWLNLDCAGYMMGDANGSTIFFVAETTKTPAQVSVKEAPQEIFEKAKQGQE